MAIFTESAICMTDFYKLTHMLQFDPRIKGFTSYLVPRGNRTKVFKKLTLFGVQAFCNMLEREFDDNFFGLPWEENAAAIRRALGMGLGYSDERIERTIEMVKKLYNHGYLPITINSLPEGTNVPIGCPAIEIVSNCPDVPWIGQAIESILSCSIWHPSISATVARKYAEIAYTAYKKTVDDTIDYRTAMCDFSIRGQHSYESGVASAAAFLTEFRNSSTIEAYEYITSNYTDKSDVECHGLTSTEHSVMTSDAILNNMDERETYRRLLTEVYPDVSFAAVMDSYDFWNVLVNILPTLREEIENHEGFLGCRHDSCNNPVDALAGYPTIKTNEVDIRHELPDILENLYPEGKFDGIYSSEYIRVINTDPTTNRVTDDVYKVDCEWDCDGDYIGYHVILRGKTTYEDKGMVETLYKLFGGSENTKGYIQINPKLKAVYGDSITIDRAEEIYRILESKGFAANNVSLGVGSFSFMCANGLSPFTRDTFSIAIKATNMRYENENGEIVSKAIYKDPKGFSQKKSLKGLAVVYKEGGELKFKDNLTEEEYDDMHASGKSEMIPYFTAGQSIPHSFNKLREFSQRVLFDHE